MSRLRALAIATLLPDALHVGAGLRAFLGRARRSLRAAVPRPVLAPVEQFEVLEPVVVPDAVSMVDVLVSSELSAEMLLHDESVLGAVAIVPEVDEDVSVAHVAVRRVGLGAAAMAIDEPPRAAVVDRRLLTAPAFTELRRQVEPLVVVLEVSRLVVAGVRRLRYRLVAPAFTPPSRGMAA